MHEFPGGDDQFMEDLGAEARTFDVNAYFVGDTADSDADALVAMLLATGAGTLVLPAQGPVQARRIPLSATARSTRPATSRSSCPS